MQPPSPYALTKRRPPTLAALRADVSQLQRDNTALERRVNDLDNTVDSLYHRLRLLEQTVESMNNDPNA